MGLNRSSQAGGSQVAAVVVNWNGGAEVNVTCVESLLQSSTPPEFIVFVDNDSSDGSYEVVQDRFGDRIQLLRNEENLGYASACNQGIRECWDTAGIFLLLNNDVIVHAEMIERLVGESRARPGAILGPQVLRHEDPSRLWAAGGQFRFRPNLTALRGHGAHSSQRWAGTDPVDFVPGCVLLLPRETVESVGFLDDSFFAYMEDVDYCLRAAKVGVPSFCVGAAVARHRGGHATGGGYSADRKYMTALNTVRLLRRHGTFVHWLAFLLLDVLALPFVWLGAVGGGGGGAVVAKARGLRDGLLGRHVTAPRLRP